MAKRNTSSKPQSETKAAAPNLFEVAGTVTPGTKAKPSRPEITLKGLEQYALRHQKIADLESEEETQRAELAAGPIADYFVPAGVARKGRPDNVRGVEGKASASIELRKRPTSSALSEEDQQLCTANGVEFQTITEYSIGKEYCDNAEVLAMVSQAIMEKYPDFHQKHPGFFQKKAKVVVTDNSLNQIFQKGDNVARMMLPVVAVIGIKPTIEK